MRCAACGSELLRPSDRRITIDRGEVFETPLPAVECGECGKMFAAEGARERLRAQGAYDAPMGLLAPDD